MDINFNGNNVFMGIDKMALQICENHVGCIGCPLNDGQPKDINGVTTQCGNAAARQTNERRSAQC